MWAMLLIGIGLVLIILAILIMLPGIGIGTIVLGVGDIVDIPLSFVMGTVGIALVTIGTVLGGLAYFLSEFWWFFPVVLAGWFLVVTILGYTKKKLKGR